MARIAHPFGIVRGAALASAVLAGSASAPAWCGTLIERGDTISVSVAEAPKFSGERKVDPDGRIMLPQLGSVDVAGLDVDAARIRLEQQLVSRGLLKAPTVAVEIARYRPLYVGGKVGRPGAIEYEPGLTVRHAIILAGGLGQARDDASATVDVAELRARWQTATYQLMQIDSRIARLNAELLRDEPTQPEQTTAQGGTARAGPLVAVDRSILADRLATWSESQRHLRDEMSLFDLEIDVLGQQASIQDQERALVTEQVEAAKGLVEKGLMPLPRLQELQRVQSQTARDLLENRAFSARAKQSRSSVQFELESADLKWRIDIRQQLREALIEQAQTKASVEALSTQILNAGADLSDTKQFELVIVIYRTVDGSEKTISARMNTEILPGDVLDVSFAKGSG